MTVSFAWDSDNWLVCWSELFLFISSLSFYIFSPLYSVLSSLNCTGLFESTYCFLAYIDYESKSDCLSEVYISLLMLFLLLFLLVFCDLFSSFYLKFLKFSCNLLISLPLLNIIISLLISVCFGSFFLI